MRRDLIRREQNSDRAGLLVSVRNATEAIAALDGGADVIDVKEPARGPLGAADAATIAEVVRAVAGRAPVTAAAGELVDFQMAGPSWFGGTIEGVSLVKMGLAGCGLGRDWRIDWRRVTELHGCDVRLAAVAYADWRAANAIEPYVVLAAAAEVGCSALLIDTWDKSAGALFDHWPAENLANFVCHVRRHGLIVALAGSLSITDVPAAASLGPDLVAVRGAACEGGRDAKSRSGALRHSEAN